MDTIPAKFVGIDCSGGRYPFTYAAVDLDGRLLGMAAGELEDALAFLDTHGGQFVAVNAPPAPNQGLVRKRLEKKDSPAAHPRGLDLRLAEYLLREHGMNLSPTPGRRELCAPWMQVGFRFYQDLGSRGYQPYPRMDAGAAWLETHPHGAFCALLERVPLPKPSLEGRLQRQLVLHANGLQIKDPMEFFEEITRHKILGGNLPMELIYLPEELDALAAACVAFLAATQPESITAVGDPQEGEIILPCAKLLDHYS